MSVQRSPLTPLMDGLLSCAARSTSLHPSVAQRNREFTWPVRWRAAASDHDCP